MTDGAGVREREIVRAFVDLSNELVADYDVVEMLSRLTAHCANLLDVASAGLLLADGGGRLRLAASSSERTHDLEVFQLQRDEGPCLDCYRDNGAVIVPDLAAVEVEHRWPAFSSAARCRLRVGARVADEAPQHVARHARAVRRADRPARG